MTDRGWWEWAAFAGLLALVAGGLGACGTDSEGDDSAAEPPATPRFLRFVEERPSRITGPLALSAEEAVRGEFRTLLRGDEAAWEVDEREARQGLPQSLGTRTLMGRIPLDPDVAVGRDVRIQISWSGAADLPLRLGELETHTVTDQDLARARAPRPDGSTSDGDTHSASMDLRVGHRASELLLLLEGEATVESLQVRELRGAERLWSWHETADADRPASGRARIGPRKQDVLLVPTPGVVEFELPATSLEATLSFSYGVLRDECGRGDVDVVFRVVVEQVADGVPFESNRWSTFIPSGRSLERRGPLLVEMTLPEIRPGSRVRFEADIKPAGPDDVEDSMVMAAFGHPTLHAGPPSDEPGLIVISLDTMRADRLGCYGHPGGLTPHVDALAESSTRFAEATAHASFTLPSHASVFSGQYPSVHGVTRPGLLRDRRVTQWLAEIARRHDLRTAAFTGGGQLGEAMGIDDGFEMYHFRDALLQGAFDDMEAWLDHIGNQRNLLFLHTYAAHHYEPPRELLDKVHPPCGSVLHERESLRDYAVLARDPNLTDADRAHIAGVYDAAVHFADQQIGVMLKALDERGWLDRNYVVLLSDHGEELFDHGGVGHGFRVPYQEQVHVPLLVRPPGGRESEASVERVVELIDVFPTSLELVGLPVPPLIQGESLVPWLDGDAAREGFALSESTSGKFAALRAHGWKAVLRKPRDGEEEVYVFDLVKDPAETLPVGPEHPDYDTAREGFDHAYATLQELVETLNVKVRSNELDAETLAELVGMGYVDFQHDVDPPAPEIRKAPEENAADATEDDGGGPREGENGGP